MSSDWRNVNEWIETDGLGGFATGTVTGERTRRYHGLLVSCATPPTGRRMLVNGLEVWVVTPTGSYQLSPHRYANAAPPRDPADRIKSFVCDPWPTWRIRLPDGTQIEHELFARHGSPTVAMSWRVMGGVRGVQLLVRPLLSGRDYHALHRENGAISLDADVTGDRVKWRTYPGADQPAVVAQSNGRYVHEPLWYRGFFYEDEAARGFDAAEDLASPGRFEWTLDDGGAVLILDAETDPASGMTDARPAGVRFESLRFAEAARRRRFATRLDRSADQYLVRRGSGTTIVAGYPWFTDWGRDTFIAMRGLCLATGRFAEATAILDEWSGAVSQGMLPNRFADRGEEPEYNAVDASLWYVIVVHELLTAGSAAGYDVPAAARRRMLKASEAILEAYERGTRYGIRMDDDGLLRCGEGGVQLTWMDAKIGDWVVTPRTGKPVDVQALWINALMLAGGRGSKWWAIAERAKRAFNERFWNEAQGCLYDVVDVDHDPGRCDGTLRPNQLLAVGGLPHAIVSDADRARRIVELVETRLLTRLGLRSLASGEPGYRPRYEGNGFDRDSAYHQGTVWPWLIGPFVEAWVRTRRKDERAGARREARQRFVKPLMDHLHHAGLGHVSEIADAEPPHVPRGCPFQAWSVGELLRVDRVVLGDRKRRAEGRSAESSEADRSFSIRRAVVTDAVASLSEERN